MRSKRGVRWESTTHGEPLARAAPRCPAGVAAAVAVVAVVAVAVATVAVGVTGNIGVVGTGGDCDRGAAPVAPPASIVAALDSRRSSTAAYFSFPMASHSSRVIPSTRSTPLHVSNTYNISSTLAQIGFAVAAIVALFTQLLAVFAVEFAVLPVAPPSNTSLSANKAGRANTSWRSARSFPRTSRKVNWGVLSSNPSRLGR